MHFCTKRKPLSSSLNLPGVVVEAATAAAALGPATGFGSEVGLRSSCTKTASTPPRAVSHERRAGEESARKV